MGDISAEPSMEDILSSIKRIIAEEGEGPRPRRMSPRPAAAPARALPEPQRDDAAAGGDEVLELNDPLGTPRSEPAAGEDRPVADAAAAPAPAPAPPSTPAAASTVDAAKVSAATLEAARDSLDSLSRLVVKPDQPGSDTLEGMVRDMLRPMLAQWLDAHLPALVEQMVAREIARITASEL